MKGEEDDDSKQNFTIEITPASFGPRGTATKSIQFSVDALKEVAGPREFTILQIYMSRSFSESELSFISVVFEILMYNFHYHYEFELLS